MTDKQQACCNILPAMSENHMVRLAKIFHLLGDTKRLQLVISCLEEPQSVCCLADITGMSQPLTSHHLRNLREARVLKSNRKGKQVFYELDDHHIRHVVLDLANHLQEHD
ncbi:transcriptional regulator [Endozoicomonas sp. (ex Bugula neritina AB1)]|nr:transcriptional regulator [Endozoicomonas sp. (ex Bugula neritina AB1)]